MALPPVLEERLRRTLLRRDELQSLLSSPGLEPAQFASLSREFAELGPVTEAISALDRARHEITDLESVASDNSDPALQKIAEAELYSLRGALPAQEQALLRLLLPHDAADARSAILEVRAGAGGDEAALFAGLLFEMYRKYAAGRGWSFNVLEVSASDLGGLREASAEVSGSDVFARLKFESGVHRIQRVPVTEASGRIHTSTATVAVLPEAEEVDVQIDDKDLRIDVFRASGAGGQHVNKTESAVRITHLPSGIVIAMQEEKSQHKNRAKAMKLLRAKLYEAERARLAAVRSADRRSQVGTGDRSERIRTYNFPQSRVTDHRIGLTLHSLDAVVNGALDELLDALSADDEAARLAELGG